MRQRFQLSLQELWENQSIHPRIKVATSFANTRALAYALGAGICSSGLSSQETYQVSVTAFLAENLSVA